ncbi:FecCD family ABC transporter permease [Nocardia acididurans]|uniref:FecCD family ABC transporter permease n=1 Tax=Nocardia acididurans TaxID=2802282 RepID=UPI001E5D1BDA|nr:iron chelate uptake ABC transporter family permease subunit [Nocardia acididurans]
MRRSRPALRVWALSWVWRPRMVLALSVTGLLVVALGLLTVSTGDYFIPLPDVFAALSGDSGDAGNRLVVMEFRLPRAVLGAAAGAALGISGAIVQSVARNPLASPDVLGITAGAGTVAVAAATGASGFGVLAGAIGTTAAAIAGGLGTGLAVYLLAWRRGIDGYRLILIGIAVTAFLHAVTDWLLARADLRNAAAAQSWLSGSLDGRDWSDAAVVAIGLSCCVALLFWHARSLGPMQLGDDCAVGVGVPLGRARALLLIIAVLLAGVAVAGVGPVPFVAFAAPQIAMRLCRAPVPPLVGSAATGALLLLGADWTARSLWERELPVGVITALLGGPLLVALVLRRNRRIGR